MAKVKITKRRTVEATGPWFTTRVDETRVILTMDFGTVTLQRTNKGLEVSLFIQKAGDQFFELTGKDGEPGTVVLDQAFRVLLRPAREITIKEMLGNPVLKDLAEKYIRRI